MTCGLYMHLKLVRDKRNINCPFFISMCALKDILIKCYQRHKGIGLLIFFSLSNSTLNEAGEQMKLQSLEYEKSLGMK